MIEFGKMEIKGFGPIQAESFFWDKKGLNIIRGPNGYGKTKFINALVWCLYGKTLTGSVETWESMKPEDYKGTMVELWFNVNNLDYRIIRCKGYKGKINNVQGKNRFIVEEDGIEWEDIDKKDCQRELEGILGYSYNLFKNSIIFGQKLKRLVSESGPNKKKVLDEAFEVLYINKANDIASDKSKELKIEYDNLINEGAKLYIKVNATEAAITREKEIIVNFEKQRDEDVSKEKENRKEFRVELRGVRNQLDTLIKDSKKYKLWLITVKRKSKRLFKLTQTTNSESIELNITLSKIEDTIKALKTNISTIKASLENIPKSCDKCGKAYTKKERLKVKEDLKESLEVKRLSLENSKNLLKNTKGALLGITSILSSAKTVEADINVLKGKITTLEAKMGGVPILMENSASLIKKIKKCTNNINDLKAKSAPKNIEKLTRTLSAEKAEWDKKTQEADSIEKQYNDYKWLITDPLSNSGLKAFIFDKMLDSVNDRLDYYSKFSGMRVGFLIDMESARKDLNTLISNSQGEYVPYEDLSGGQQQKVDIVTVFAIHDIISETKSCSLLVMDELFESLDRDNIELLTDLIQDKAKDKCLYLITHRYEFSPTNANLINILNNQGVTSIEN